MQFHLYIWGMDVAEGKMRKGGISCTDSKVNVGERARERVPPITKLKTVCEGEVGERW